MPRLRTLSQLLLFVIAALIVSTGTPLAHGQSLASSSSFSGSVSDSSGARVANANVTLTSPEKGITRAFKTDAEGSFSFSLLPAATYTLTVQATGFKTLKQEGITLEVGQSARQSVALTIGSTEQIEVNAVAPLLQTDNANVGDEIGTKQVAELPLNLRNVFNFVALNSSVNNGPQQQTLQGGGTQGTSDQDVSFFNFGGGYFGTTAFLLDGSWDTSLARHKNSGYLHALMADTFAEQRSFIQAAEAYKASLASPPYPAGTHAAYGFVLLNQRDFPGAERELNAELAASPGAPMARLGLARLHLDQGQASTGAGEVADIWKADAAFLRANISVFIRGLAPAEVSELDRALQESKAAGEIREEVAALFESEAAKGNNTASSDPLEARVQQIPLKDLHLLVSYAYSTAQYETSFGASQTLAQNLATEAEGLYWETRSAQKLATLVLARASNIDSDSPTMHVLLGDVYRQRRYYPDAEQEYRKALVIQPGNAGALLGLSLTLLTDSETDEALHLAKAALEKSPDDPEINAVMGEILSAQHDFSGAEPYLKKALKTKPELIPHVHALLGRVYAEANRTQDAINELKMGLPDDKDGRLHYQLARLYLKVGDQNSAKRAFEASERLRSEGLIRAAIAIQQGDMASQ